MSLIKFVCLLCAVILVNSTLSNNVAYAEHHSNTNSTSSWSRDPSSSHTPPQSTSSSQPKQTLLNAGGSGSSSQMQQCYDGSEVNITAGQFCPPPMLLFGSLTARNSSGSSEQPSDYTLGMVRGTEDGKVGVYDPAAACALNQAVPPHDQTTCTNGYKVGYVTACTAPGNKFGCGDGPTTLG